MGTPMNSLNQYKKENRKMFEARYPRAVRALRRAYSEEGDEIFLEMLSQIDDFAVIDPDLMEDFRTAYDFWR